MVENSSKILASEEKSTIKRHRIRLPFDPPVHLFMVQPLRERKLTSKAALRYKIMNHLVDRKLTADTLGDKRPPPPGNSQINFSCSNQGRPPIFSPFSPQPSDCGTGYPDEAGSVDAVCE